MENGPYRIEDMSDVLIYADSIFDASMRNEVPIPVPDPFLYVEKDGERHAVVTSFEVSRPSGSRRTRWRSTATTSCSRRGCPGTRS